MGLQLPGELISLLAMLGYTWPEADEQKLFDMGNSWIAFGTRFSQPITEAGGHAQTVWTNNQAEAVDAFRSAWQHPDSPAPALDDSTTAATIVGAGLMVCGGIVLTLKINVMVQLTILAIQIAQALATAGPTLGASLLEIPIFKEITGLIIDQLIDMALSAILAG